MARSHPVHRVRAFEIVAPYTLKITFQDGVVQVIDFRPVLEGELYGPLRELSTFNQVRIDPEVHTLIWPNGADFDPTTLHDWPEIADQMVQMARRWTEASDTSKTTAG